MAMANLLTCAVVLLVLHTASLSHCQSVGQSTGNQLSSSVLTEVKQRALFPADTNPFRLDFNTLPATSKIDNAAVVQLQGDKAGFPLLSTLPNTGSSVFLTALKPCGILLPHVHQRATEIYTVLSGTMTCGIAEENGGRQDLTFETKPGQAFVAPQGLLHFNHNKECNPLVFVQSFNSADPGALNVVGALAAFSGTAGESVAASNFTAGASPQRAFALDQACLARCGFPSSGAPFPPSGAPPFYPRADSSAAADSASANASASASASSSG